ncbi:MAG: DciA family protein [Nitrospinales bacterium]
MERLPKQTGNWVNMSELLSRSLAKIDAPRALDQLNFHWTLTVGRRLAAVSRIDRLASRTLHVRVADKSWVAAFESLEKDIISELNRRAGETLVSRLTFREGGTTSGAGRETPAPRPASAKNTRRRARKPRVRHTMAALSLLSFAIGCASADSSYQLGTTYPSGTYIVKKVVYKPAPVRMVAYKKTPANGIAGSYRQADNPQAAARRIRERSEQYLKKALALQQNQSPPQHKDPEAYYNFLLALREERVGNFGNAAGHYRRVIAHDPATEKFYPKLAHLYLRDGKTDQVIAVCRNGLERFPENAKLMLLLAEVLAARGENREALAYLEKIPASPHNTRALLLSGLIYGKEKNHAKAEKTLNKATLVDPTNSLAFHLLGRNYALNSQYAKAEQALKKTLALRPSLRDSRILLAWVLEKTGNFKEAAEEYNILMKLDPENTRFREQFQQLKQINSGEQDIPSTEEFAGPLPGDSSLYLKMGMIFFEQTRYTAALEDFRLVLAQEEKKNVRLLIARIYEIFQNYKKAIDELNVLLKQEPESVEILLQLARMYHLNEETGEAIKVLQTAARLYPDNDRIYRSLSLAYMAQKQPDRAIQYIRKALELDQDNPAYYFELGALLEQVGRVDEAIETMHKVLEIDSRHSNAHNFIGYLYAIKGEQLDQAVDHLEKALAVQPQNGYFLDSLGWIYFRKGETRRALAEIKKAMIYTSPDAVIYNHLGDIQFALKNYKEAGRAWKTSLSLTRKKSQEENDVELPDPKTLEEKINKLNNLLKTSF